ncbi:hypothetical protein [Methanococcoides sp. FTZ1]|uniref:hypothetical protein n=1 Tax=Methanococcoides sp. FTZ1 TaxID=3439061 RepID=UPI003F8334AE
MKIEYEKFKNVNIDDIEVGFEYYELATERLLKRCSVLAFVPEFNQYFSEVLNERPIEDVDDVFKIADALFNKKNPIAASIPVPDMDKFIEMGIHPYFFVDTML